RRRRNRQEHLPGAQEVRPGQIWAYADPSEVSSLLHLVTAPDVRMLLEDYRVIPPTLEDVYVAVTRRGFE
ncbi:MAG: hypothetical protein K6V36_15475, partial [Anaerolineae bacterium]|nr:hypothetical protein [Anaerolineae bacterium]